MYRSTLNYLFCFILAMQAPIAFGKVPAKPVPEAESLAATATAKSKNPELLRATAIVTNAQNHSAFQCWVFNTKFIVSTVPGTAGAATLSLANLSNITYSVLPPGFDGGRHNAPYEQIVVFLSGEAVVSLPHSAQTATIKGGANGLIVAVDVAGDGHITKYPSNEQTIGLQLPFAGNKVPGYRVSRHDGPCAHQEQIIY